MKRLTAWLDRAWQPAGFVAKQYDGAPFGRCYVTIDPARQAQYASANWNRIYLCGAEPNLCPDGLAPLIEEFTAAGVRRCFAWLSPGPEMNKVRGWLTQSGFSPRMRWTCYPTLVRIPRTAAVPDRPGGTGGERKRPRGRACGGRRHDVG